MDYVNKFSEMVRISGYFNQDWGSIYTWNGKQPTFQPIIRLMKLSNSVEVIEKLISEIERFLLLPLNNEEFETIMVEELGCEYTPRSQGLNKREFLEQSLEILKEPMEETRKHFIPEFI